MNCIICFDGFNKSTRAEIKCPYCTISICRSCFQQYLLNDINSVPVCVNIDCGREWTREWIDEQSTRVFRLTTYKSHREKVLKDRELSRLPEVQGEALSYSLAIKAKEESNKKLLEIKEKLLEIKEKIRKLELQKTQYETMKHNASRTISTFGRITYPPTDTDTDTKKEKEPVEFIKHCPVDGCRGFLSTAWKCGMCEKWACSKCLEVKGESKNSEHTCDPEKVASAQLIQRETRPCPKCGIRISKINGCDQMWCTSCKTGFSWRNGSIAKGPIHNPHYSDWIARNGGLQQLQQPQLQTNQVIGCNDTVINRHLQQAFYSYHYSIVDSLEEKIRRWLLNVYRKRLELVDYRRDLTDSEENFRRLRVRYMNKEISEEQWSIILQRTEKAEHFKRAKRHVEDLFLGASNDILLKILDKRIKLEDIKKEMEALIEYVNEAYANISKRFGQTTTNLFITSS